MRVLVLRHQYRNDNFTNCACAVTPWIHLSPRSWPHQISCSEMNWDPSMSLPEICCYTRQDCLDMTCSGLLGLPPRKTSSGDLSPELPDNLCPLLSSFVLECYWWWHDVLSTVAYHAWSKPPISGRHPSTTTSCMEWQAGWPRNWVHPGRHGKSWCSNTSWAPWACTTLLSTSGPESTASSLLPSTSIWRVAPCIWNRRPSGWLVG